MIPETSYTWEDVTSWDLKTLLEKAREIAWSLHGKRIQCFIPGRMVYMGEKGRYPSISLTGTSCALNCDHCNRKILEGMIPAKEPNVLQEICHRLDKKGNLGVLLSGGSDENGALPWSKFLKAIKWVKQNTKLKISVHTGIINRNTALSLKDAGIDEFLVDVVGSDETMDRVYHLPGGLRSIESSLESLSATGLPLIPHIVVGLHYGRIKGEMNALDMIARHNISALVIVIVQPIRQTPMEGIKPPEADVVARVIAAARLRLPAVPIALSCTRPHGRHRVETDVLALEAGINRIAMPSEEVLVKAREMGLDIEFYKTCCSKSY